MGIPWPEPIKEHWNKLIAGFWYIPNKIYPHSRNNASENICHRLQFCKYKHMSCVKGYYGPSPAINDQHCEPRGCNGPIRAGSLNVLT